MIKKILCKIFHLAINPYGISHKGTDSFRFCFALSEFARTRWKHSALILILHHNTPSPAFSVYWESVKWFYVTWYDANMTLWFHCRHDHTAPPPSVNQGQQGPGVCGSGKWYGHTLGLLNSISHHLGFKRMWLRPSWHMMDDKKEVPAQTAPGRNLVYFFQLIL